jgi:hypothetical protein
MVSPVLILQRNENSFIFSFNQLRRASYSQFTGSQAYANFSEIKADGISKFQQHLVDRKINHILGRVHHPQTNGMYSKSISPASIEQLLL